VLNQFAYIEMKVPVPEYFVAGIGATGYKFSVKDESSRQFGIPVVTMPINNTSLSEKMS